MPSLREQTLDNLTAIETAIKETGGCTVYNSIKEILNGTPVDLTPRHGYCVGDNRCSVTVENYHEFCFLSQPLIALRKNTGGTETAVGFWIDSNTGTLYVDKVTVVSTLADALNEAAARGELAIWDMDLGREIRLNN
jgi:hypothetical protein